MWLWSHIDAVGGKKKCHARKGGVKQSCLRYEFCLIMYQISLIYQISKHLSHPHISKSCHGWSLSHTERTQTLDGKDPLHPAIPYIYIYVYIYIYIHMKVKMSLKWEIVRLPTPCCCLLCKLTSKQPIRLRPAMTAAKFAEVIEPWSTWIGRCPVSWL